MADLIPEPRGDLGSRANGKIVRQCRYGQRGSECLERIQKTHGSFHRVGNRQQEYWQSRPQADDTACNRKLVSRRQSYVTASRMTFLREVERAHEANQG